MCWLHVARCRNPYAHARQLPAMAPAEIQGVNRLRSTTSHNLSYSQLTVIIIAKPLKSGLSLRSVHSIAIGNRCGSVLRHWWHPTCLPWLPASGLLNSTSPIASVRFVRRVKAVLELSSAATLQFTVSRL